MAKRKFEPGDRVVVHGKDGRGEGRVAGIDPESGMVRIAYTKLEHGGKTYEAREGVPAAQGYAPPEQLTRE